MNPIPVAPASLAHVALDLAGTRRNAGLGISTVLADLDFETRSEAGFLWDEDTGKWLAPEGAKKKGLEAVGVARYAEHPTTDVLSLSYNLKDGKGPRRWRPGFPPPLDLWAHVQHGRLLEAWNSAFEWWIWNLVCVKRYGFPPLPFQQLRCAMSKARAAGYPGKLGEAGQVMELTVQKDTRGYDLLKRYSIPQTPTKSNGFIKWIDPATDGPTGELLYLYNDTDIETEAEASARCPDLDGEELDFWLADQLINRRGVHVDRASLDACKEIVRQVLRRYDAELYTLTGGAVERASQLARLKTWLETHGVHMGDGKGSMDDKAIDEALKRIPPSPPGRTNPARRALELRKITGSASVKKVFAMSNQLSSWNRLHDLIIYHGARTGRPTGGGPQPLNMPKAGPSVYQCHACARWHGANMVNCGWCGVPRLSDAKKEKWTWEAVDDALEVIRTGSMEMLELFFGDALLTVSGCIRGLFTAAPSHDLIASDFSAIESVVTAVLAGEQWRIDLFNTHGKNYEMSASQISGVPFSEIMAHAGYVDTTSPGWWTANVKGQHHPLRQTLGKVAELASGFGGWIAAWKKFGADEFMSDEEIKAAILAWRKASPEIVHFWGGQKIDVVVGGRYEKMDCLYGLEGMVISALLNPDTYYPVLRRDGSHTGVTYVYLTKEDALYCILPSGRPLTYRRPRLGPSDRWNSNYSISFEGNNSTQSKGKSGWQTMWLYGGLLCENVVQAVARDIQRSAILGPGITSFQK
jgi:DNA polymerase